MSFNIAGMAVDSEKQMNGCWIDITEGLRLKIARMGNPNYTKALNKALEPMKKTALLGLDPQTEKIEDLTKAVIAETILLDWEGMQDWLRDASGEPTEPRTPVDVEYSKEAALAFFDKYPDFYEIVLGQARVRSNFEDAAEIANSKTSPAT